MTTKIKNLKEVTDRFAEILDSLQYQIDNDMSIWMTEADAILLLNRINQLQNENSLLRVGLRISKESV